MDTRWFEDVLVLLEERNLTRAAARRNVTQPAFSRRIRSFERWLGTSVLRRGANAIEIDPSLLANEREIRALTARIEELRGAVRTFRPERVELAIAVQHALMCSTFPDIAAAGGDALPALDFRVRVGDRDDCVAALVRGDAQALLCYEEADAAPMPFDDSVFRLRWGTDRLLPLVGGELRRRYRAGRAPARPPSIVYPEDSYFGSVLGGAARRFSTRTLSPRPAFETAYSTGMKELALRGLGVAWLPLSLTRREIDAGELLDLSRRHGGVTLDVALYGSTRGAAARALGSLRERRPSAGAS